jgi:hypothetical protein
VCTDSFRRPNAAPFLRPRSRSKAIELAVEKTVAEGIRTADIAAGGKAVGTKAMGAAILARL